MILITKIGVPYHCAPHGLRYGSEQNPALQSLLDRTPGARVLLDRRGDIRTASRCLPDLLLSHDSRQVRKAGAKVSNAECACSWLGLLLAQLRDR